MPVLIDSSAWIDYLEGSKLGEDVRKLILSEEEIYALPIIISEVISKVQQHNKDTEIAFKSISSNAIIYNPDIETAKQAGILHANMVKKIQGLSLADSIIHSCAKKLNAKILTKDNHLIRLKKFL